MEQNIIDEAVRLATKYAMHGCPVERIVWIPPATASMRHDECPLNEMPSYIEAWSILDSWHLGKIPMHEALEKLGFAK